MTEIARHRRRDMSSRQARGRNTMTIQARTGSHANMIVFGAQPGAKYMTRIAGLRRRRHRHVTRWLAGCSDTMTTFATPRRNVAVLEQCRNPAGRAMTVVAGSSGHHVAARHTWCLAGTMALRTGTGRDRAVVKP